MGMRDALCQSFRAWERSVIGLDLPPVPAAIDALRGELDAASDHGPRYEVCEVCGQTVGGGERTASGCASCRGRGTPIRRIVRIAEYGGSVATRILQTKHLRWHAMAEALGRLLGERLAGALARTDELRCADAGHRTGLRNGHRNGREGSPVTVLVPVPMPFVRRMCRGIDHTHEIARGVRRVTGLPILRLLSQRPTGTQVGRSPTERRQSRGRFRPATSAPWTLRLAAARWGLCQSGFRAVLIDDVLTTGGTVEQAARVLRELGAGECWAAVLAVAPDPARSTLVSPQRAG